MENFLYEKNINNADLELNFFLPLEVQSLEKEEATKKSIINFYKAFTKEIIVIYDR